MTARFVPMDGASQKLLVELALTVAERAAALGVSPSDTIFVLASLSGGLLGDNLIDPSRRERSRDLFVGCFDEALARACARRQTGMVGHA